MLSVHLEILEEVQSLLVGEIQKLYEIEEKIKAIRKELLAQDKETFVLHIISMQLLINHLFQEIGDFRTLITGLDNISQSYRTCEQKNILQNESSSSSIMDFIIGKLILDESNLNIRYYQQSDIDTAYEEWISPLLNRG